jgi:hypothetical protein
MKRCPECYEIYENSEKFCELDGHLLLADPALLDAGDDNTEPRPEGRHLNRESWLTGLIGVMAGILLCAGVYAAYTLGSIDADSKDPKAPAYTTRMQGQLPQIRQAPARIPEPVPTETPSPEVEVEPSPESSAPTTDGAESHKVAVRLNQGPVSTGPRRSDAADGKIVQTIIQMNDGTAIEADAAWEDNQGVWYRRGGLVSFVESQRVKAITARAEPKTSADSNQ